MYFGLERTFFFLFFFFLIFFLLWIIRWYDFTFVLLLLLLLLKLIWLVLDMASAWFWPLLLLLLLLLLFKLDIKLIWLVLDFGLLGLLLSLSHINWVYNWVLFCFKNNYFSQILFKYSIHIFFLTLIIEKWPCKLWLLLSGFFFSFSFLHLLIFCLRLVYYKFIYYMTIEQLSINQL